MFNRYRSRSDSNGASGRKKYIILGIGAVLAISFIFASGYIVGIKVQAKRDNSLLRDQDPVQKPQIPVPPISQDKGKSGDQKPEAALLTPEPKMQNADQVKSQGKTEASGRKDSHSKEPEGQKPKERDLTFYKALTTNKKQAPVGLEPAQDKRNRSNGSTEKSENPNKIYTVQVGAYKEMAIAEKVRNKLKIKGYPAYIVEKKISQEGTIYKVRVGEMPNRDKAEEIAKRIKEKERMSTFVTLK